VSKALTTASTGLAAGYIKLKTLVNETRFDAECARLELRKHKLGHAKVN
jgi:hypothetical protein